MTRRNSAGWPGRWPQPGHDPNGLPRGQVTDTTRTAAVGSRRWFARTGTDVPGMISRWKRDKQPSARLLSNRAITLHAVVVLGIGAAAFTLLW